MPRCLIWVCFLWLGAGGLAHAQSDTIAAGPLGTPMTPSQIGAWIFVPSISKSEAAADAQAGGFGPVTGLRRDGYGNWIGESGKGMLIVFPDGQVFPR